jgi:hypothetical protein
MFASGRLRKLLKVVRRWGKLLKVVRRLQSIAED